MTEMEGGISIKNVHVGGMTISQNQHETSKLLPHFMCLLELWRLFHTRPILIGSRIFFNYRSNILSINMGERWNVNSPNIWLQSFFHCTIWLWQHTNRHHYLTTWGFLLYFQRIFRYLGFASPLH